MRRVEGKRQERMCRRQERREGRKVALWLQVLMLGKNRIRKIEGLTDCPKLSVLDLHGNR